ncbi:MAG TPA: ECF-type sigma factor [Gemmataceae bacterium]|jgi:RNA polymerase sigma factor (TIGR02999 family)
MADVTQLLASARAGDQAAAGQLLPLVYDELRKLAAARLAAEPDGHTLQPTALVHEAYLRLVGPADAARWDGRGHFFAAAAEAMRRILVDQARRKRAARHGGGRARIPLDEAAATGWADGPDLVALDDVLDQLAAANPRAAELVKLRFFAGFTGDEVAQILGVSPRSADLLWAYARAWLFEKLDRDGR